MTSTELIVAEEFNQVQWVTVVMVVIPMSTNKRKINLIIMEVRDMINMQQVISTDNILIILLTMLRPPPT